MVSSHDEVDSRMIRQLALARGSYLRRATGELWLEDASGRLIPVVVLRVAAPGGHGARLLSSIGDAIGEASAAGPARPDAVALIRIERPFVLAAVERATMASAIAGAMAGCGRAYREVWVCDAFGDPPIEVRARDSRR